MVPSYPSRARPCPARSCRADNCRRVVDDASRALILYDAATQRGEDKFITVYARLLVSRRGSYRDRESPQVYLGVAAGVAKKIPAYRENVDVRGETFRAKCPLVHLRPPPPSARRTGELEAWVTIARRMGYFNPSKTIHVRASREKRRYLRIGSLNPDIYPQTASFFSRMIVNKRSV